MQSKFKFLFANDLLCTVNHCTLILQGLFCDGEKAVTVDSIINNSACASCHAWLDQDQVQFHRRHLLTRRQMSSCQVVSSSAVTFVCRNAVRWGLLVIKLKRAPVFCFFPLFPFVNALTTPRLPV